MPPSGRVRIKSEKASEVVFGTVTRKYSSTTFALVELVEVDVPVTDIRIGFGEGWVWKREER